MKPELELQQVIVRRGGRQVLSVDQISIYNHETLAVIGPNGSGKSTLLLALARLIEPDSGQILFRGQNIREMQALAYRRRIALVLQDPLLLSGSVDDNVAVGLRFRGVPPAEINKRVQYWLEKLGIAHLRKRMANSLSGGEAQRVSLARSFVLEPDILMLDEPFSALDAPTRRRLLDDIHQLLKSTPVTSLFVTHDMNEALLLADRVAVLLNGRMVQMGSPQQVFTTPASQEVAAFVGVETIIPGTAQSMQDGLVQITAGGFRLEAVGQAEPGSEVYLCLRPEDITLWTAENVRSSSARNQLQGRIERLLPEGPLVRVQLDCGFMLVALITRASAEALELQAGMRVAAGFKASAAHIIPR